MRWNNKTEYVNCWNWTRFSLWSAQRSETIERMEKMSANLSCSHSFTTKRTYLAARQNNAQTHMIPQPSLCRWTICFHFSCARVFYLIPLRYESVFSSLFKIKTVIITASGKVKIDDASAAWSVVVAVVTEQQFSFLIRNKDWNVGCTRRLNRLISWSVRCDHAAQQSIRDGWRNQCEWMKWSLLLCF